MNRVSDTDDGPVWDAAGLGNPHAPADKSRRVRRMFNAIAPTYELINTLFSAGRDAHWRRKAVALAEVNALDRVLDVACGTGGFARVFAAARPPPALVVGCDFAHAMLRRALPGGGPTTSWCEADALRLPFADGAFTITSCAFGVRNFQDLDTGLREMHRVLATGGHTVILEFTRPPAGWRRAAYEFYASRIMPVAATLISRDRTGAYRYLPSSVVSFTGVEEMGARLERVGFDPVTCRSLTGGVVTVYVGYKRGQG